jgi:hypothetical protein
MLADMQDWEADISCAYRGCALDGDGLAWIADGRVRSRGMTYLIFRSGLPAPQDECGL